MEDEKEMNIWKMLCNSLMGMQSRNGAMDKASDLFIYSLYS